MKQTIETIEKQIERIKENHQKQMEIINMLLKKYCKKEVLNEN